MNDPKEPNLPAKGQFLVYQAEDGRIKIDVRLEDETVWLTQQHMADLFQTTQQNVSLHLQNIFDGGRIAARRQLTRNSCQFDRRATEMSSDGGFLQPRRHHLRRLPRQKRRRHPLPHLGHAETPREPGQSTNVIVAGMLPNTTYLMRHVLNDGTTSAPLAFATGSLPGNLTFPTSAVETGGPTPDRT